MQIGDGFGMGAAEELRRPTSALDEALESLVAHGPKYLWALGALLGLYILARVVRAILTRTLGATKLDEVVGATRIGKVLGALSEGLTASRAVAQAAYFTLILFAVSAAASVAELDGVQSVIGSLLGYVPSLLTALAIVAIGGYFASLVGNAVGNVLKEMRSPYAKPLSGVAETGLLLLSLTIAIDTLGIDLTLITSNLTLILGALTLTLCFLFGWAMRSPASEIVANYYVRRMVSVGDHIEFGEFSGTVEKFAAIGVILRTSEGALQFVPGRHVLDGLRQTGAPSASSTPDA